MVFDLSINLGTVLQTAIFLGSVGIFIINIKNGLLVLKEKVDGVSKEVEKLREVTIEIAKQDQRLLHLEEQIGVLNRYMYEKISA